MWSSVSATKGDGAFTLVDTLKELLRGEGSPVDEAARGESPPRSGKSWSLRCCRWSLLLLVGPSVLAWQQFQRTAGRAASASITPIPASPRG